jgi:uncharacterized protein (TIGR03067 family)
MKVNVFLVLTASLLAALPLSAVPNKPPQKKDPVKEELRKLEGTWECTGLEYDGLQYTDKTLDKVLAKIGNPRLVFKGKKLGCMANQQTITIDLKIDPKKKPKAIDLANQVLVGQANVQAIYELKGDTLKTCYRGDGRKRPAKFTAQGGANNFVLTWKRVKK